MSDVSPNRSSGTGDTGHRADGGHEARFYLAAGNRVAGLIEYILILPIVAAILCPVGGIVIMMILEHAAVPKAAAISISVAGSVLILVILIRFAIRDYRRRAGSEVEVTSDCISVTHLGRGVCVPLDDVSGARLVPYRRDAQFVLCLSDGRQCRLPVEIAPFSVARAALETALVDRLGHKMGEEIARGKSIRVSEGRLRPWVRMVSGVLSVLSGALITTTIRLMPLGVKMIRGGVLQVRRGWRGRKTDFEVTREGLQPTGSITPSDVHPWSSLDDYYADDAGLVLQFNDAHVITASIFSQNYWSFLGWVRQLRRETRVFS
jgi:hypothetical protein